MQKLGLAFLLIGLACVLAGIYGMLHNQISYTVSHEYFTKFKFNQFGIDRDLPERVGAAQVGFLASWWMGLIISLFIVPVGMIFKEPKRFFIQALKAFGVVALTALLTGMVALIISYHTTYAPDALRQVGSAAQNLAFRRAGTMHNHSYLGGGIGIITGILYLIITRIFVYRAKK